MTLSFRSCSREICAILTPRTQATMMERDGIPAPTLTMIHNKKLVVPLFIDLYSIVLVRFKLAA
jgi:hypothetical protein